MVGNLVNEYPNVLFNELLSGPSGVTDFKRFSTVLVTLPASSQDFGLALIQFSDMFQWKRLSVMSDTVHVRLNDLLKGIIQIFRKRAVDFDILTTQFDSASRDNPYPKALVKSSQHSRSKYAHLVFKLSQIKLVRLIMRQSEMTENLILTNLII
jgi:hypothetical protein